MFCVSACSTCLQALTGRTPVSRVFLLHFLLTQLLSGIKEPCISTKYFLCLHVMLSTQVLLKAAKIIQKLMSIPAIIWKSFERKFFLSNLKTKPWMSPFLLCLPIQLGPYYLLTTGCSIGIRDRRILRQLRRIQTTDKLRQSMAIIYFFFFVRCVAHFSCYS